MNGRLACRGFLLGLLALPLWGESLTVQAGWLPSAAIAQGVSLSFCAAAPAEKASGPLRPVPRKPPVEAKKPAPKKKTPAAKAAAPPAGPRLLAKPRPLRALAGNDAVDLLDQNTVKAGQTQFMATFDSQVYLFSQESNQERFKEDAQRYAPALGGASIVSYRDSRQIVPGNVEWRVVYQDRLFLFANEQEKQKFDADPQAYADADLVLQGFSTVSLVDDEVLRRGQEQFETIFDGRRIRLASQEEHERFLGNPGRYYPSLGGIDPVTALQGKPKMGIARFSVVYKNRLFAMSNSANRDEFIKNPDHYSDLDVADNGRCPVSKVEGMGDKLGHYGISTIYLGQRFLFANDSNRQAFVREPQRFCPEQP